MYKLLLVDDEIRITRGLKQIIPWEQLNCVVVDTAYNGEVGLRLAEEIKPDIIITDIHMPYMDGLEMITLYKKLNLPTKYIILSGYSDFSYAQKGIEIGINNYLLKPVVEEELERCIHKVIQEIESERQAKEQLNHLQAQYDNLYTSLGKEQEQANESESEELSPGLIQDIKKYMHEHHAENLSLVSVAEQFYMNPSYLSQLFMKKTNTTFLQYLTQIRINKSARLLKETDLKVYEISSQVGYKDAKYFSKIFEKTMGKKPVDYRQQRG